MSALGGKADVICSCESRGLNLAGLEGSAMSQDAPSNAGELIGERDGKDVVMQSLLCRFDPRLKPIALPMLWPHLDQHHPGRLDEQGCADSDCPVLICCRGFFGSTARSVSVPAPATRRSRGPSKTRLPFRLRPPSHSR